MSIRFEVISNEEAVSSGTPYAHNLIDIEKCDLHRVTFSGDAVIDVTATPLLRDGAAGTPVTLDTGVDPTSADIVKTYAFAGATALTFTQTSGTSTDVTVFSYSGL